MTKEIQITLNGIHVVPREPITNNLQYENRRKSTCGRVDWKSDNVRSMEALSEVDGALTGQRGVLIGLGLFLSLTRHLESELRGGK
jgi:hypothetical protein